MKRLFVMIAGAKKVVVVFMLITLSLACSASASVDPMTLGGLLVVLQQLRSQLDAVSNNVDQAASARIHQIELALDGTIKELQAVIKDGFDKANTTEQKVFSDVYSVMGQANTEFQQNGYWAYVGANSTLANAATVLEGIPFVKVKPYMFAVTPIRIEIDDSDRLVSFYGHFPDIDESHKAKVKVRAEGVAEKTLELGSYPGGRIGFVLPPDFVREGRFVELVVSVPIVKYYVYHTFQDFDARLYVAIRQPFTFAFAVKQGNPELWATLPAPSEDHERADSGRTSNNQTLSSRDLFSKLVSDNTTYDMDTAAFAAMESRKHDDEHPCDCCDHSKASLDRWDSSSVSFSLYAPTCGDHMCSVFNHCGGGGTNADIWLKPTFKVKRRNVPEHIPLTTATATAKRRSETDPVSLQNVWSMVEIVGVFRDGKEEHKRSVTVTRDVPVATTEMWTASVENGNLKVQTR
ncbi:hypothetical protein Acid345_4261 [Candidatus Koribacter versatilis Ellin345]|uniref:Uncharacterized protein n=1 Tax=Koribacter versatilis (strain Ellin345) TaxID=204669 RepID=Q1IIN9_KORVE|nr:hypothetical protein [Candidatus Koribacter versatilis]ABF43261.1 hypothetical protein Acid345_4261 [Candidatus Koribacter versatilis Ellin345]